MTNIQDKAKAVKQLNAELHSDLILNKVNEMMKRAKSPQDVLELTTLFLSIKKLHVFVGISHQEEEQI